jgi:hypothetical protein
MEYQEFLLTRITESSSKRISKVCMMGAARSSNERDQKYLTSLGNPEEKRPLEYSIRRNLEENVRLKTKQKGDFGLDFCLKIWSNEQKRTFGLQKRRTIS